MHVNKAGSFLFLLLFFFCSCNKDKDSNGGINSRLVKYEITGTFRGKVTIFYNDNINGLTIIDETTLPWSKEISYAGTVTDINIIAQSSSIGGSGQTAAMKIYAGGNVVKSTTATAGSSGQLALTLLAYKF